MSNRELEDSSSEETEEGERGGGQPEHHDEQGSRDESSSARRHRTGEGEDRNRVSQRRSLRQQRYENYCHDLSVSTATESTPRSSRASTMDSEIHGPTSARRHSRNNLDRTKKGNQLASVDSRPVTDQPHNTDDFNTRPPSRNRTLSPYNEDSIPNSGEQKEVIENRKNNISPRPPSSSPNPRSTPSPKPKKDKRRRSNADTDHCSHTSSQSTSVNTPSVRDVSVVAPPRNRTDAGRNGAAINPQVDHTRIIEEEPHEEEIQENVQQMNSCVKCCRRFRFSLLLLTIFVLICGVIFIPTWALHISGPTTDRHIFTSLQDYVQLDTHPLTAEGVSLSTELQQETKNSGINVTLQHGSCEKSWGDAHGYSRSSRSAYNKTHFFSQHVFNFGKTANLDISVMINQSNYYEVCFYLFKEYADLTNFVKNPPKQNAECGSKELLSTSETVQCSFIIQVLPSTNLTNGKRGNCTFGYSGNKYSITCTPAPCRNKTFTGHHYFVTRVETDFSGPVNVNYDFNISTTSILQKNTTLTKPAGVCKKPTNIIFNFLCSLHYGNLFSLTKEKPCTFADIQTVSRSTDTHSSVLQLTVHESKRIDVIGYSVVVMALPVLIVLGAYLYWVPIPLSRKIVNAVRSQRTRKLYHMLT